jgi:hypothetical protein
MTGAAGAPLGMLAQTSCPTAKIVWAVSSHFPYRFQPSKSLLNRAEIAFFR